VTPPDGRDPDRRDEGPRGTIEPVSQATLALLAAAGLVIGWLLRPVSIEVRGTAPFVSWPQPGLLLFVAVALAITARQTRRAQRGERPRLESHQAVNRLALARASVYVGSLVAGGYAGYAVAWLGSRAELAGDRLVGSAASTVAAGLVVAAGVALERACRVPEDREPT